ncbi:copper resistance CopC/CopD family protein [Microvirga sp. VF16]|uniref:copper resistance CopC/CopD family protein n=1 Tax=Microvirga sp. VF16 TaxID=2807101 RepID=UPI00193CCEB3|nr:copper resistance protein CopC [Microvirga sp. VF16]QRM27879.1 copper resistance protein CopC [Microvirga sp. VF16]
MFLTLLLMTACVALGPREARAHASLMTTEPSDGAVLKQAPNRIVLHFTEPVSPLILRLIGPNGEATDLTQGQVRHQAVEITPPASLRSGSYALSWRVISADGHPIGGSLIFSIGSLSPGQRAGTVQASRPVQVGLWSARWLMYIGAFVGGGGAFFVAWIAGRSNLWGSARLGIVISLWGGAFATVLSVGLQGLDALALPLQALGNGAVWLQGFRTAFGITAVLVLLGFLTGLLSLAVKKRWYAQVLSGAALVGVGIALAASGHASTAEPQWLTRTSIFLHVTGLSFWIGALMPLFMMLLMMLRRADPQGVTIMNRFSVAILPIVIILMIAGAVLAVIQVGSVQALWSTPYGTILLLKLLAVVGLLALAAANRLVLTPVLAQNQAQQRTWFARSIAAEGVLVLLILGLVAGWRFTPPPRATVPIPASPSIAAPEPISAHFHTSKAMAQITLDPGRAGRTTMLIKLVSASGAPLNPKDVVIAFSNPSSGIEPFERHGVRMDGGTWHVDDLVVPIPGQWLVRVDALVSDFDKIMLEGMIEVRP